MSNVDSAISVSDSRRSTVIDSHSRTIYWCHCTSTTAYLEARFVTSFFIGVSVSYTFCDFADIDLRPMPWVLNIFFWKVHQVLLFFYTIWYHNAFAFLQYRQYEIIAFLFYKMRSFFRSYSILQLCKL